VVATGRKLTGKMKTTRVKITCSNTLYQNIKRMIEETGEFTDMSDFASSAAKHLLNIMFTDVIPEILEACKDPDNPSSNLIEAKDVKFVSGYDDETTNFQVTLTAGLQQAFWNIEFCLFKKIKVSEMYRYALEHYFNTVMRRQQWSNQFLADFTMRREMHMVDSEKIAVMVKRIDK